MNKPLSTSLQIVLVYCLVIFLVLLWSGKDQQKGVYDLHFIDYIDIELPLCNQEVLIPQLVNILEFSCDSSNPEIIKCTLPDSRRLLFVPTKSTGDNLISNCEGQRPISLNLYVRNGLTRMHEYFKKQVENFPEESRGVSISDVVKEDGYNRFEVSLGSDFKAIYQKRALFR